MSELQDIERAMQLLTHYANICHSPRLMLARLMGPLGGGIFESLPKKTQSELDKLLMRLALENEQPHIRPNSNRGGG